MVDVTELKVDYFPFNAVVGQDMLKRFLTMFAICPGLGDVLISGPKYTMKERTVKTICIIADHISDDRDKLFLFLNSYNDENLRDKIRTITNEKRLQYLIIPSIENYDIEMIKDILSIWRSEKGVDQSLILIKNVESPEDDILDVDFKVDVRPIKDIEQRIEMIKREREFQWDFKEFLAEFRDVEKNYSDKIKKARKMISEVNIAETLSVELKDKIMTKFSDDPTQKFDRSRMYAKAEAAYQGRRWVSREDIEAALRYIK